MTAHQVLIGIACLCWLVGAGFGFYRSPNNAYPYGSVSAVSAGLLFFGISLLIKG
jgi:hypothetical protein